MKILRGDVYLINFEPSVGGEIQKKRPGVVVSNNSANKYMNRVQVVPLTTSIDRLYPCEAYVTVKDKKHKAMADQITTISKQRILRKKGQITVEDIESIERIIKIQLDL